MTNVQKSEIIALISQEEARLGSLKKVANKCACSPATLSLIKDDKYAAQGDEMWRKIGAALGWKPNDWQIAPITNLTMVHQVLRHAKDKCLFIPISHQAGSGKSKSIEAFVADDRSNNVFTIQCREWSRRAFLVRLAAALGIAPGAGSRPIDGILEEIIDFFKTRPLAKPLLIIDEADKLKPSALRVLIPIYNELEDRLGVVIAGTENLHKEIKRGVQYNVKGYDELDSRFGRNYIHLVGATLADVRKVCEVNGVTDAEVQKAIYFACAPKKKTVDNKSVEVVEDLRRLKREVQRYTILNEAAA
jgi:hypothetical protein